MSKAKTKRKVTRSEIFTDLDDDSYTIPPAAFSKAAKKRSNITTRNSKVNNNLANTVLTVDEDFLKNITFPTVKHAHSEAVQVINSLEIDPGKEQQKNW